jgi:hypothetical protein
VTPIFRRRKLELSWEYKAEGIIWRLHPGDGGLIIGEERNIESRTATFFSVNQSGTLWKRKNFGEQWWTGIEAVHRGVLFLYGFATPDLPGRRGITAVDCSTGELLWTNNDLTFIAPGGDTIYASQDAIDGPVVLEIDLRTGAQVREAGRGSDAVQQVPRTGYVLEDTEYPQVLLDEDASPLPALVRKLSAPAAAGCPVEYGEHGPFLVIVYHRGKGSGGDEAPPYVRGLDVVDRASETRMMHFTLDEAVSSPAYGSFLVHDGVLYFVRERKTLTAVPLRAMQIHREST